MFSKELKYIMGYYGMSEQMIKLQEENYELQIAIGQHKLALHEEHNKGKSRFCSAQTKEHLVEELADVTVVSLQVLNKDIDDIFNCIGMKYDIPKFILEHREEIEEVMKHKISRTIKRINEKKYLDGK